MEKIEIKVINKSGLPLPEYKTADAAGMDLRAHIKESIWLESLERTIVPTGLSIELPKGYEAQIRPRSGLTLKSGLSVINSPGTIDADYRGEIKIILANLSSEPQEIKPGERIAQMVIAKHEVAQWIPVEELSESGRGAGGFGHTGQK